MCGPTAEIWRYWEQLESNIIMIISLVDNSRQGLVGVNAGGRLGVGEHTKAGAVQYLTHTHCTPVYNKSLHSFTRLLFCWSALLIDYSTTLMPTGQCRFRARYWCFSNGFQWDEFRGIRSRSRSYQQCFIRNLRLRPPPRPFAMLGGSTQYQMVTPHFSVSFELKIAIVVSKNKTIPKATVEKKLNIPLYSRLNN